MNSSDAVRIYNASCPSFDTLLRKIKRRSTTTLGHPAMPVDGTYSAGVWKRLFLIGLKRFATKQSSLARLTAVQALQIIESSSSPTSSHPKTAAPRYLIDLLKEIDGQPLRGLTRARNGFHPEDLARWVSEAQRVFRNGVRKSDAVGLWNRCSSGRSRMPSNLLVELKNKKTALSRARAFVGRVAGIDEETVKVSLHRWASPQRSLQ